MTRPVDDGALYVLHCACALLAKAIQARQELNHWVLKERLKVI